MALFTRLQGTIEIRLLNLAASPPAKPDGNKLLLATRILHLCSTAHGHGYQRTEQRAGTRRRAGCRVDGHVLIERESKAGLLLELEDPNAGAVNLTTYRRKEAVAAAFRLQPLHTIVPWRQFEIREACGGISDGVACRRYYIRRHGWTEIVALIWRT